MINTLQSITAFLVLGILFCSGCAAPKQTPNPLDGWKYCPSNHPIHSNQTVLNDYSNYIQNLEPKERNYIGSISILEDGTGQHAVGIEVNLNGTRWTHVLFYDKEDKRTKLKKYVSGRYRS